MFLEQVKKPNYIKPVAEVFELPQNLNLLNSASLGADAFDYFVEGDEEDWGDFIPYP